MVNIIITADRIHAIGHAESKPICGLFSGIGSFVMLGLEATGEDDAMLLARGTMEVVRDKVLSANGKYLVEILIDSMVQLSAEYPDSFSVSIE